MTFIPGLYAGQSSGLDEGTTIKTITFEYQPFVAAGTQSVVTAQFQKASSRQFLLVGNGSTSMTQAVANGIVQNSNGTPLSNPTQSQRVNLATGMLSYFFDIEAVGDGTSCVGFAVGGLDFTNVVEVGLRIVAPSNNYQYYYKNYANPIIIGGPQLVQPGNQPIIQLSNLNELLLPDGSNIEYPNDTLMICPAYGVIFGCLQKYGTGTTEFTAGNYFELEIKYR